MPIGTGKAVGAVFAIRHLTIFLQAVRTVTTIRGRDTKTRHSTDRHAKSRIVDSLCTFEVWSKFPKPSDDKLGFFLESHLLDDFLTV
jgi:hypothetical protein